jgi:hypothetical protein
MPFCPNLCTHMHTPHALVPPPKSGTRALRVGPDASAPPCCHSHPAVLPNSPLLTPGHSGRVGGAGPAACRRRVPVSSMHQLHGRFHRLGTYLQALGLRLCVMFWEMFNEKGQCTALCQYMLCALEVRASRPEVRQVLGYRSFSFNCPTVSRDYAAWLLGDRREAGKPPPTCLHQRPSVCNRHNDASPAS